MTHLRRRQHGFALAVLSVACIAPAAAETSPYYIGVSQRFTHQSNVFQTSAVPVSDTQSSTSLIAGLDQPFGRQRLFGSMTASANRYQDNTQLNHTAYAARLGLDWSTVERVSGNVAVDASQSLSDLTPAGLAATTLKSTTRTQGIAAGLRVGVVTPLTAEATLSHRSNRNSGYAARDLNVDEGSIGVKYRPGGALVVGAAIRLTHGEYPNYPVSSTVVAAEGFDKKNLDLSADWPLSGASAVNARLSFGRDRYDSDKARDFSGLTGSLGWSWAPTSRLSLTTSLSRVTGDDVVYAIGTDQIVTSTSIARVRNTLALSAGYEVTAKIAARAGLSVSDGTVINPGAAGTATDRTNSFNLGLSWAPTRSIRTGCDLSRTSRSAAAFVTAYDANSFGCFGEFTLR